MGEVWEGVNLHGYKLLIGLKTTVIKFILFTSIAYTSKYFSIVMWLIIISGLSGDSSNVLSSSD